MEAVTYQIEAEVGEQHWWFRARRRILADVLAHLPLPARPRIYDLGCGTGHNLIMLQDLGEATGVDMSPDALAHARALGCRDTLVGDLTALPIPDDTADVIVASDILEHLDDDGAGAREIARVLKGQGEGVAVITVPAFRWLWGTQDDVSHHRRRYTRRELATVLEGAGLTLEKLTYFNAFLLPPIWLGRTLIKVIGAKPASENTLTPGSLDGVLYGVFSSERFWLRRSGFPLGVSVLAIARKR